MAEGDLLLAGIASALLKNTKPATGPVTTPTGSNPTASFTSEQLDQLAGTIAGAVRSIEIPAPVVNVPPAKFPSDLQVKFTDDEIQRLATALRPPQEAGKLIETRVLTLDVNGATVNSSFPTLRRLVTYQFTQSYQLIAVSLSCSIVNVDTAVAGLFFGRDMGEQINIEQQSDTQTASDIFISQLTHQNSTLTTIAPLSRTNTVAFSGDKQFIQIQGGSRLALYGCATSNANTFFSAVVNIHVIAP